MNALETPILFVIFRRPDTTARVFEAIRQARPRRLYVAGDGPRSSNPDDQEAVARTREIATAVDWPCEVITRFSEKNLGCKRAVWGALDWFFAKEEAGIILEDDCLPHPDFFPYCSELLERFRNTPEVSVITGQNFQGSVDRGDGSYYFSRYLHVWGWASWRRTWAHYDGELSFWPAWRESQTWGSFFRRLEERRFWTKIFNEVHAGEVDTWDYQLVASTWRQGAVTVVPNVNLVSNIGFGAGATHTHSADVPWASAPVQPLGPLTHPSRLVVDEAADALTYDFHYEGRVRRFPWNFLNLPQRLVQAIKRRLR